MHFKFDSGSKSYAMQCKSGKELHRFKGFGSDGLQKKGSQYNFQRSLLCGIVAEEVEKGTFFSTFW